jgi:hypothetical protein
MTVEHTTGPLSAVVDSIVDWDETDYAHAEDGRPWECSDVHLLPAGGSLPAYLLRRHPSASPRLFLDFLNSIFTSFEVAGHPFFLPYTKWSPVDTDSKIQLNVLYEYHAGDGLDPIARPTLKSETNPPLTELDKRLALYCVSLFLKFLSQKNLKHGELRSEAIYLMRAADGEIVGAKLAFVGWNPTESADLESFIELCATVGIDIGTPQNWNECVSTLYDEHQKRFIDCKARAKIYRQQLKSKDDTELLRSPLFLRDLHSNDPRKSADRVAELVQCLVPKRRNRELLHFAGIIFEQGIGVPVNAMAAYWFYQVAELESQLDALTKSTSPLIRGQLAELPKRSGSQPDCATAIAEYRKCGDLAALAHLGDLLAGSSHGETNATGMRLLEVARDRGSGFASFALACRRAGQEQSELFAEAQERGFADAGVLVGKSAAEIEVLLKPPWFL